MSLYGASEASLAASRAFSATMWGAGAGVVGVTGSVITLGALNGAGENTIANALPGAVSVLGLGLGATALGRRFIRTTDGASAAGMLGAGYGLTAAGGGTLAAGIGYNMLTP